MKKYAEKHILLDRRECQGLAGGERRSESAWMRR
jgi:hypothetical protein